MKKYCLILAALAATAAPALSVAQSSYDETQQLISKVQTDKRAVVLGALGLDDAKTKAFTPIYDDYQAEMKDIYQRSVDVLNKFGANYESMTDDAAKSILKDWFKVREDKDALIRKYAKKLERELPATDVLRFVQVENKLNALMDVQAAAVVPLATKK